SNRSGTDSNAVTSSKFQVPSSKSQESQESQESQVASRSSHTVTPNSSFIDCSAPVSSLRSRAKQKRTYPSPLAPKSTPGTHPIRPLAIRYLTIRHDTEVVSDFTSDQPGSIRRNA